MELSFINQSSARAPERWLRRWVKALSKELAKGHPARQLKKDLVVVFVDRREMKRLNRTYRGKNYATDVLSFSGVEPSSLGELVICPDVIREQAKRTGLGYHGELGYMIIHGVLHLLGYDHETSAADEKRMFALQDKLFERLRARVGLR